jgi:hypothetical protein
MSSGPIPLTEVGMAPPWAETAATSITTLAAVTVAFGDQTVGGGFA